MPARVDLYYIIGVEVKNAWSYNSALSCIFMAGNLVKHKDNLTFALPKFVRYNRQVPHRHHICT
jgi:hypothetical protein